MKRYLFATVLAFLIVVLPGLDAIQASGSSYIVEDLGTIDGLVPTVTGMNASGEVSGYVQASTGPRAVRYTGSQWGYVPGVATYSLAMAINDSGDVAGYHHVAAGFRAFRYTATTGVTTTIDPLEGGTFAIGFAINASAEVVGYGNGNSFAGVRGWRAAPGMPTVMLPTLGGGSGIACGINDAGQVVGAATTVEGYQHAYRVEADTTTATDIVPFDGPTGSGRACAVDASGRAGGFTTSGSGTGTANRAFVFVRGAPVTVDTFAGSAESNVAAIANGVSVGWFTANNAANAFVHVDENGSANLNDLIAAGSGWLLDRALAVNTAGQIAGNGRLNTQPRAFRLTPVAAPKDTTAPIISSVSATPSSIWPPNGKMVTVTVSVSATDDVDSTPQCDLTSVSGGDPNDAVQTGRFTASVRAEKNADASVRVYSLNVTCSDSARNESTGVARVVVGKDSAALKAYLRTQVTKLMQIYQQLQRSRGSSR